MTHHMPPVVRTARILPDALLRRILPSRLAFDGADAHMAHFGDAAVRLFIGPTNYAGQGWAWARAAERIPNVSAVSMASVTPDGLGFAVDQQVPASVFLLSRRWARAQRNLLIGRATHVLLESGRSPFPNVEVASAITSLSGHGVRVALLGHGSDVRDGERHRRARIDSHYHLQSWERRADLEDASAEYRALIARTELPVFVSTPGLLEDVPHGRWLPVVIDPEVWTSAHPPLDADVPLVVHAPSSTAVKGTDLIEPVLQRLVDEGLIRYRRLTGIPSAQMPAAFAEADIVLDQFRLGDYGVAACEALAAGRVVIGDVETSVRAHVRAATGMEPPIVQASASGIGDALRRVLHDRDAARRQAALGPVFVRAVHDGARSAEVLRAFLES